MVVIISLLLSPLLLALIILLVRSEKALSWVVRLGAALILLQSVVMVAQNFGTIVTADLSNYHWLKYAVMLTEVFVAGYVIYVGIKNRSWLVTIFSALQVGILFAFEFTYGHGLEVTKSVYIDKLSQLMILIVGVIGSLICIYAIEYMKDYHHHHKDIVDRRKKFFAVLFFFMSAMFGLVMCNDMTLMLFCWEITSLCSFLLIGYTKTKDAVKNSFTALTTNVGGGLAFTIGIVVLGVGYGVLDFNSLLNLGRGTGVDIAILLLAIAGLTKSAQMPFSKWLLGAMVAPTPSSALLHSSTMVKAGVYLILRLAPLLGDNIPGIAVTLVGGVTFLVTAILAISQSDAKKILAYSTISNLGLIVTCAGINTAESLWAAIMLIVFHAVAKSLLFCSVGSTEHLLGSRDVEDMDGLYRVSPALAMLMIIGIAGMFVAPFGMLISKWAAMKAFLDSGNTLIVLFVAFGSTLTLFFWTKWMGKLIANAQKSNQTGFVLGKDEKVSMYTMAGLVVVVCLMYPIISNSIVIPYIDSNFHINFVSPINTLDTTIIIFMMCLLFVLPLVFIPFFRMKKVSPTSVYLSGENTGDNESFRGGYGETVRTEMRNWYMSDFFNPELCNKFGMVICGGTLLAAMLIVLEVVIR